MQLPMLETTTKPGMNTESEILSEPTCWIECLGLLQKDAQVAALLREGSSRSDWMFIGCGSSYYLALAAAASWTALTGLSARAVPASELLLFPDLLLNGASALQPVLISRSGRTSEVLEAAEYLRAKGLPGLAITCTKDQPIEGLSSGAIRLPPADEKSTVMTRSFTSMLMGLQFLAARRANNSGFPEALERAARAAQAAFGSVASRIRSFVQTRDFADYVWLGQGPFYGIACEGALKVTEMSCSYAQAYHSLEFRHGPKSIVGPETLIGFLISKTGFEAECKVLEEIKKLGATTLVVANKADERTRALADLLIDFDLPDGDDFAHLAAHVLPGQLLGLYTGLKKGLDPDSPRHLSRAVILD